MFTLAQKPFAAQKQQGEAEEGEVVPEKARRLSTA
jgi:hypothetical protein